MYKNMKDIKFDLDDIVLVPAKTSHIENRRECQVTCNASGDLPLMVSPMDTVVSEKNYRKYYDNSIIVCLPRGFASKHLAGQYNYFQAFGLYEIEREMGIIRYGKTFKSEASPDAFYHYQKVLIDIANGHMSKLIPLIKEIKAKWPDIELMIGNVANPKTFVELGLAGADCIRISVGTGAGCTTASNVAVNYPLGSLISECYVKKQTFNLKTKIVADGGMRNYSDIIKALALGSDYVMCGSIFNKAIESAGFNYLYGIRINNKIADKLWRYGFPIKKKYRGMSTKAVQRSWGKTKLVTAEGITKYQKVEYTLEQWVENFKDYLKSAMSYCNAKTLNEFIGKAEYIFISEASRKRFLK